VLLYRPYRIAPAKLKSLNYVLLPGYFWGPFIRRSWAPSCEGGDRRHTALILAALGLVPEQPEQQSYHTSPIDVTQGTTAAYNEHAIWFSKYSIRATWQPRREAWKSGKLH
jgi:hypothetical protein